LQVGHFIASVIVCLVARHGRAARFPPEKMDWEQILYHGFQSWSNPWKFRSSGKSLRYRGPEFAAATSPRKERPVMSEHRAAVRHHILRTGIVEFDNGTGKVISAPCTIRDVSGTGARLGLNASLWVAEQFTLVFSSGLRKDCRVAWRKGRLIGSAFADGYASADEQAVMMTADEQSRHRLGIGARVRSAREARLHANAARRADRRHAGLRVAGRAG
jgi:hypothetical protein